MEDDAWYLCHLNVKKFSENKQNSDVFKFNNSNFSYYTSPIISLGPFLIGFLHKPKIEMMGL